MIKYVFSESRDEDNELLEAITGEQFMALPFGQELDERNTPPGGMNQEEVADEDADDGNEENLGEESEEVVDTDDGDDLAFEYELKYKYVPSRLVRFRFDDASYGDDEYNRQRSERRRSKDKARCQRRRRNRWSGHEGHDD